MSTNRPILRFDVATNDWVLFAPARARRPSARPAKPASGTAEGSCPFCPGNEHLNPHELARVEAEHGAGWSIRVVPNKFPALVPEATPDRAELGPVFLEMGGYGFHEVVIESPEHARPFQRQSPDHIERVLQVVHGRFAALMADPRLQAVIVFKNHGEGAGTSISHPHWQIIATPVVPRQLRLKHAIAADYFDRTSKCLYCTTLKEELADGSRVLATNDAFAAVLPFASHVPFQVRILPRTHRASFGSVSPDELRPLGAILQHVLGRLDAALGDPDFNLTVETAPLGSEAERYFLWHIDILPRLSTPAGFELGSGMSINPTLPEDAALALREPSGT